ncbi:MAG: tetratricopeptide repeat protein [Rhodospirillaceae bacterium]|nr:tetratricopeptide repeat protein [Rhodospirillaceae bacterium]
MNTAPPSDLSALLKLAASHQQAGNLADARDAYLKVLPKMAKNPDLLNMVAILCQKTGQSDSAIGHLNRAVKLAPKNADFINNLGNIHLERNEQDTAAKCYKKALTLNPDLPSAHYNLGLLAGKRGEEDQALAYFKKTVELDSGFVTAWIDMGNAYKNRNDLIEAEQAYKKAIEVAPDYYGAHYSLAILYSEMGRIEEAIAGCNRTLELNPTLAKAYLQLSDLKKFKSGDSEIKAMEKILESGKQDRLSLTQINFSLAKAYADLKAYDQAFQHLVEGNTLHRATFDYDAAKDEKHVENIMAVCNEAFFSRLEGQGSPDETPVFIFGMPRSGTTLIEQVLSRHSQVFGAGELSAIVDVMKNHFRKDSGYPEILKSLTADDLRPIGEAYIKQIRSLAPKARFITDKMPVNFMYLGFIAAILPNAKFIHCRRNPIDNCFSCYEKLFKTGQLFSFDLTEAGRFYRAYDKLMDHWHEMMPGKIIDVQYEDVVADLEGQSRRLLNFCGLDWDEACLTFYESERNIKTSSLAQVRKPIYRGSVEKWRPYKKHLQPLIEALGPLAKDKAL